MDTGADEFKCRRILCELATAIQTGHSNSHLYIVTTRRFFLERWLCLSPDVSPINLQLRALIFSALAKWCMELCV